MNQVLHQRGLWSLDELTAHQAQALLATARAIKQAKGHGQPLKGKHVAVLCECGPGDATDVYSAAARGLGAQVTCIRPSDSRLTDAGDIRAMARILGRLYDAIECDGMDPAFMLELARTAAVPVSNVLLQDRHPTRMLADLMTMQEVCAGPQSALTVCVIGDERSPWSVAWRQVAAVCGVVVLAGTSGQAADPVVRPIVFVCDLQGSRCTDGQPALRAVGVDNPRGVSLARRQVANHRYVVQALLSQSVG